MANSPVYLLARGFCAEVSEQTRPKRVYLAVNRPVGSTPGSADRSQAV